MTLSALDPISPGDVVGAPRPPSRPRVRPLPWHRGGSQSAGAHLPVARLHASSLSAISGGLHKVEAPHTRDVGGAEVLLARECDRPRMREGERERKNEKGRKGMKKGEENERKGTRIRE